MVADHSIPTPLPTHSRFINILGQSFNGLTVLEYRGRHKKKDLWLCLCSCDKRFVTDSYAIRSGHAKSCGCRRVDNLTGNTLGLRHGLCKTPEWRSWYAMVSRCTDSTNGSYRRYGAVGITVCDRWLGDNGFASFLADMGHKPTPKHTIDRIENAKGYSPENCRWADIIQQANNTRTNRPITFRGRTQNLSQWARELGCSPGVLLYRLKAGWSVEDAFSTATSHGNRKRKS
jgi:hypothetical protein